MGSSADPADRNFTFVGDNFLQRFERRVGANFDSSLKRFKLFFIK
jgi:hypothetical protein